MSEAPVRPGDMLAGKYRVERILGAGNMGVVVAAMHVELGQRVALKFLQAGKSDPREQRDQRERFLREARAAGRLKSQHVARVLDVGTLENEAPYIVMEFLEGHDLSALLKARGPLPFEEAAMYMLQACEAVGEAHAAGIVHRDLKPANLFCAEDVGGSVCIKVLDFGISKLSGVDLTLTNEAEVFGSPLYMSPEQMRSSKSVDARSDIWSLGVVLYQLVAGRTPFHSESITELCSKVLMGEAMPLSAYRGDAPAGFEAVILRCLERDREQRFADVAAFAAALAPYAPEHARVYAGRVARAMGRKGAPAASVPELPPARAPLSSSLGGVAALSVSASQTTPLAPKVESGTGGAAGAGAVGSQGHARDGCCRRGGRDRGGHGDLGRAASLARAHLRVRCRVRSRARVRVRSRARVRVRSRVRLRVRVRSRGSAHEHGSSPATTHGRRGGDACAERHREGGRKAIPPTGAFDHHGAARRDRNTRRATGQTGSSALFAEEARRDSLNSSLEQQQGVW